MTDRAPLRVLGAVREQPGGGQELRLSWETRRPWRLLRGQGQALIVEGQEGVEGGERGRGFGRDSGPGLPAPVTHPGMKRGAFGALSGDVLHSDWGRKMEGLSSGPQLPFPCACPLPWVELQSYPNPCLSVCWVPAAFPPLSLLSASSGQSFEHQSRGERGGGKAGSAFSGPHSLGPPAPGA